MYGQSYDEMEARYFQWKRRKQVTWRAYLSATDIRASFEEEQIILSERLVGARHFSRLHTVFARMIFDYKTDNPSRDWIETSASHLTANSSDFDDMEKAARDILRTLIRQTFLLGICWLTQMYSYLLDNFRVDVKRRLLQNDKYSYLRTHYRFLHAVDLEYHIIMRTAVHDAIRFIRDSRDSNSAYAHYDITIRMIKLVFSIPPAIKHEKFNQRIESLFIKEEGRDEYTPATLADIFKHIPASSFLERIYGSETFLTEKRDPYTGSHHDSQRSAIQELYIVTSGRLLQDIHSSFNSNVVMKIHNIDRIDAERQQEITNRCSLYLRISSMTDYQISHLGNVNLDEINKACHESMGQIVALSKTLAHVDIAIQQMNSDHPMSEEERQKILKSTNARYGMYAEYLQKRQEQFERQNQAQVSRQPTTQFMEESEHIPNYTTLDEEQELMAIEDPTLARAFIDDIYHKHDLEDLTYGFLDGDSLDQDKRDHPAIHYSSDDPDDIYDIDSLFPLASKSCVW